jgi:hypothetical protein
MVPLTETAWIWQPTCGREPDHADDRAEPDHADDRAEPDHADDRAEPDHADDRTRGNGEDSRRVRRDAIRGHGDVTCEPKPVPRLDGRAGRAGPTGSPSCGTWCGTAAPSAKVTNSDS